MSDSDDDQWPDEDIEFLKYVVEKRIMKEAPGSPIILDDLNKDGKFLVLVEALEVSNRTEIETGMRKFTYKHHRTAQKDYDKVHNEKIIKSLKAMARKTPKGMRTKGKLYMHSLFANETLTKYAN